MSQTQKVSKRPKAFTLIEILVSMSILGVVPATARSAPPPPSTSRPRKRFLSHRV